MQQLFRTRPGPNGTSSLSNDIMIVLLVGNSKASEVQQSVANEVACASPLGHDNSVGQAHPEGPLHVGIKHPFDDAASTCSGSPGHRPG
jgi:hypothetical protein